MLTNRQESALEKMRMKFQDDYDGENDFGEEPTDNAIAQAFSSGIGDGTIRLDEDEEFTFSDDDDDDCFTRMSHP